LLKAALALIRQATERSGEKNKKTDTKREKATQRIRRGMEIK
jgi:hypothetical protein